MGVETVELNDVVGVVWFAIFIFLFVYWIIVYVSMSYVEFC